MKPLNVIVLLSLIFNGILAQNEANNWFFGNGAGLDFSTDPPTVVTTGPNSMGASAGCSVSDGTGNLLFYSDGTTVWDQTHAVMANGSGLAGAPSAKQSGLAVKQPGNNLKYYLFTNYLSGNTAGGLYYSVIDMGLGSGLGSVTVKNISLQIPACEKMAATKHCNGVDTWVVTHEYNTSNFTAYLVTAAGLITTPVVSAAGPVYNAPFLGSGTFKFSPWGTKLVTDLPSGNLISSGMVQVYDFDNNSGIVSQPLTFSVYGPTDPEFSPDGGKLYVISNFYAPPFSYSGVIQWDLCAGTNTQIAAARDTVGIETNSFTPMSRMQVAPNGKIYISKSTQTLVVINDPNNSGNSCNFNSLGQSIAPKTAGSFPVFVSSLLKPRFTYTPTTGCPSASFSIPPPFDCMPGYSITSYQWQFGDIASGAANSSTNVSAEHNYPAAGTYTAMLVMYNSTCTPDTLKQVVTVQGGPPTNITGKQKLCLTESTTITATGASSYTWSTGVYTPSIAVTPTVTTVYTLTTRFSNNCTAAKTITVTVQVCNSIHEHARFGYQVYPNPGQQIFTLVCPEKTGIEIYNQTGVKVFETTCAMPKQEIDIGLLADGLYFVRFQNTETTIVRKLIKTTL